MKLLPIETYVVEKQNDPVRLSDLPAGTFKTLASRKAFKKAIKKGLVTLNGQLAITANFVTGGEEIIIHQNNLPKKKPSIDLRMSILYEDDCLAIVVKPAGIVVSGNKKFTVENALSANLEASAAEDVLIRPEPVHRLDYPTSGCLLVAKTSAALIALNKMFEQKQISKSYHAICVGAISSEGIIETSIENKASKTHYKCLHSIASNKYDGLNLVELSPATGRKHQLRIHLSSIGNPILGDSRYGIKGSIGGGSGLYLHASSLQFIHPITSEEVCAKAPIPKKFLNIFPKESFEK